MSTLNGSAAEPQSTLTVPTVGADTDLWGGILNDTTLQTLLNYVLWLKARVPATDPSGEDDGRTLVVSSGALVFGDAASGGAAADVTYDNGTSGLTAEDVQAAIDELASEKADTSSLGTAAAADTGDFATAAQGGLADTALQPGDELTELSSGAATAGYVPKADGAGGIAWGAESGGGGPVAAEDVVYDPTTSGLTAEDVQAAIDEVYSAVVAGGIPAASGIVIARGGSDPDFPDPNPTGTTYWQMSVAPNNRKTGDLWLETGAYD